ncbi:hypothetical protein HYQ46_010214 [Verticillium longisporum]|nr:hypothetical protein HYQ46_010214 [Verticillium longisporum]
MSGGLNVFYFEIGNHKVTSASPPGPKRHQLGQDNLSTLTVYELQRGDQHRERPPAFDDHYPTPLGIVRRAPLLPRSTRLAALPPASPPPLSFLHFAAIPHRPGAFSPSYSLSRSL